jgi:hypothetical protein
MRLTIHNRPLLRAWLASAAMLAGAMACGGDRAETGSSQGDQAGAATLADTGVAAAQSALIDRDTSSTDTTSGATSAAPQPGTNNNRKNDQPKTLNAAPDTSVSGYQAMARDRADTGRPAEDTVVVGDSAEIGKAGERLEPTQSSEQANADTLTTQIESDRVRPPEDSTEMLGNVTTGDSMAVAGDTAVTGSPEMARDTSTALAQADTMAQVQVDTATQVTDASTQVAADTAAAIQAQVDTTTIDQQTEVAVETPADSADTLAAETERVRPPEDSTEVLGNVTTQEDEANQDVEVVADQAPTGAVGAQTSGTTLTGAEAVAQLTREGQRCVVVETEEAEEDIRWDLASSPASMNPCGTGTMTLPRIQTEE